MALKVGFLANQLDNRGTGNALFDYAKYNETLLKNESRIYTYAQGAHSDIALLRFQAQFGDIHFIRKEDDISPDDIDVLYHIKSGRDDGFRIDPKIRYVVHAVFNIQPHGDRYAAVSRWLGSWGSVPWVPHVVNPIISKESYVTELGIQNNDLVIGRHGAYDTFDIPWVWEAIYDALDIFPFLHFVFMNTEPHAEHPRIHFLDEGGPFETRKFLNTCDVMIHARMRGETFGIAVGEFAVFGKPVMTYGGSAEKAHIEELGKEALLYYTPDDITRHIENLVWGEIAPRYGYALYSPTYVMEKFKEVFLS